MYRVEISRVYDEELYDGTVVKDMKVKHIYEVKTDFELASVLRAMQLGVDGEYTAHITHIGSEGDK